MLITRAQNNADNMMHFRVNEIVPYAHFNSDHAKKFAEWLQEKKWVTKIEIYGTDSFACKINENLFESELNKMMFKTQKEEQHEKT